VIISSAVASEAKDGVVGAMNRLKTRALTNPTFTRFLAAGYVTVLAQQGLTGDVPPLGEPQLAIVDHVKHITAVDPNSVVVFGASHGGYLALKVAAEIAVAAVAAEEPPPWSGYDSLIAGANGIFEVARVGRRLLEDPRQAFTPEVRRSAQEELRKISGPIFLAAGDLLPRQQVFVDIYNEFLIPDLKAAGQEVEAIVYPGQPHAFGFFGGLGPTPIKGKMEAARTFFEDMHAFFSRHLPTQPESMDDSLVEDVPVCDALQRRIGRCDHAPG
jgi:dienelactone hydrolase